MKDRKESNGSAAALTPDEALLSALSDCAEACTRCLEACLHEEHVSEMINCIQLDRDCAAMCQLAFSFTAAQSEFAADVLKLCAEVCARCSAECRLHPMEHCGACADACLHCEQACRDFLKIL